jgi:sugar-specific transcriptional regulator TrmB
MELEKKFKQQLEDQAKNYETNIENLLASMRVERDDMKKEHLAKMKILTNQHEEELHGWTEQHADLMKAIHLENQNRFESCIATMQSDYDNFKDKMKRQVDFLNIIKATSKTIFSHIASTLVS